MPSPWSVRLKHDRCFTTKLCVCIFSFSILFSHSLALSPVHTHTRARSSIERERERARARWRISWTGGARRSRIGRYRRLLSYSLIHSFSLHTIDVTKEFQFRWATSDPPRPPTSTAPKISDRRPTPDTLYNVCDCVRVCVRTPALYSLYNAIPRHTITPRSRDPLIFVSDFFTHYCLASCVAAIIGRLYTADYSM